MFKIDSSPAYAFIFRLFQIAREKLKDQVFLKDNKMRNVNKKSWN